MGKVFAVLSKLIDLLLHYINFKVTWYLTDISALAIGEISRKDWVDFNEKVPFSV